MTSGPDISSYDPFEDTGDWPFRDAPPKPDADERPDETPSADADPPSFHQDTELSAEVVEEQAEQLEAEPLEVEPPIEEPLPLAMEEAEPEPEPAREQESEPEFEPEPEPVEAVAVVEEVAEADVVVEEEPVFEAQPAVEEAEEEAEALLPATPVEAEAPAEHAPGELLIPPGLEVLAGGPHGFRRNVAVVVSRFNGDITTGLLDSALAALRDCNVADDAITVVPVPGAFELPLTALALAKTRRYSCVVALGCIIRGETPHFDLIASEAASGLQLAAIETGIPVAFGVITTETREQAEERIDRGGEAARTALEMADLFSHVRTRAAAS
jgi:6,7-dimethyl-8-ribityllumazine synthase